MGFTPREVDEMSLWEFRAVAGGYSKANGGETAEGLHREEFEALAELIELKPISE